MLVRSTTSLLLRGAAPQRLCLRASTAARGVSTMLLGTEFPDISADSTQGPIRLHEYLGDSWGLLMSHPAKFTPVCTTELGAAEKLHHGALEARNVKVLAMSCDSVEDNLAWLDDIEAFTGARPTYPILADENRELATQLGMLSPELKNAEGLPLTVRAAFVIGPDKLLKLSILYPASTGRNFDEIIRAIDSLQLTANRKLATPVNWAKGEDAVVLPSVPEEEARELYPDHRVVDLPSGKPYLRLTADPTASTALPNE